MTKLLTIGLLSLLVVGCTTQQPWYAKMAERNPDCVGLVQHMSCQEFVESSRRVNQSMVRWLQVARTEEERQFAHNMYIEGLQNLSDVGVCP